MTVIDDHTERQLQWLQSIRAIAKQTNSEPEIVRRLQQWLLPASAKVTVNVVGAPNVGKSALINALLERPLAPVSPLPTRRQITITGTSGQEESQEGPADIRVDHQWMVRNALRIVEKAAVDVAGERLSAASEEALQGADVVVLVIDALAPIKKSEAFLLAECHLRGLPTVVAVTKTDGIPESEARDSLEYIRRHVSAAVPDAPVVERNGGDLRQAIEDVIRRANIAYVRARQRRRELLLLLDEMRAAAGLQRDEGAIARAAAAARQSEDDNRLANDRRLWLEIEAELHQRRQSLDENGRGSLQAAKSEIVASLALDLQRSTDVKGWWRHELRRVSTRSCCASAERNRPSSRRRSPATCNGCGTKCSGDSGGG